MSRPLGSSSRRVLLLVELHQRRHGHPPTWRWISEATGTPRFKLVCLLHGLRDRGYLRFEDNVAGSLEVTQAGLRAALREAA